MDQFSEFITFVNDLIVGGNNFKTNKIDEVLKSNNIMDTCNNVISDIISKHSQIIKQSAYINKKITVDCGSTPLYDPNNKFYLKFGGEKYDFFGTKIDGTECPRWGCCYDINQSSNIKLSAINKSVLEKSEEMYNKVTNELIQNVDMTVAGHVDLQMYNDAKNTVKNETISSINETLTHITDVNISGDQDIKFISKTPLKCITQCNEPPSAGEIKQSLNIDIATQNITTSIFKNIHNNVISQISETKTTFSDVNQTKLSIFAIMFIIVVICIYLIVYTAVFFIKKIVEAEMGDEIDAMKKYSFSFTMNNLVEHVITIICMLFIMIIYKIVVCLWRNSSSSWWMMAWECKP